MNLEEIIISLIGLLSSFGFISNGEEFRSSDLDNAKCDSVVCASIVSKCILTSDCKCDNIQSNKTCADNCSHCLDYLYQDCCLCFDLCEKPKDDESEEIQHRSNVGHIKDPQPDFFALLTESPDPLERWKAISYSLILPFDETIQESEDLAGNLEMKCTVAYMSQCISLHKCRTSCASMGSTTFRWFHDGCCECVGQYCNEFGLSQSNCTACPLIVSESTDINTNNNKEDF